MEHERKCVGKCNKIFSNEEQNSFFFGTEKTNINKRSNRVPNMCSIEQPDLEKFQL